MLINLIIVISAPCIEEDNSTGMKLDMIQNSNLLGLEKLQNNLSSSNS